MTDHPSSFKGDDSHRPPIQWDDRAALHRTDDGDGVFDKAKGLRDGTFAGLIRHLMQLPEDDRAKYCIAKAGDRQYSAAEAAALSQRPDFPAHGEENDGA